MNQPRITANVSEKVLERAKIEAIKSKKSLREWAGEAIERALNRKRDDKRIEK